MAFDKVFLGGTGLSAEHGFSNSNMLEAEIKQLAIQKAQEAYVVLDHTKFGVRSLFSFAAVQDVTAIVTDRPPDPDLADVCRAAGTRVILA